VDYYKEITKAKLLDSLACSEVFVEATAFAVAMGMMTEQNLEEIVIEERRKKMFANLVLDLLEIF